MSNFFYQLSISQVLTCVRSNQQTGLTAIEVKQRIERDGHNILPESQQRTLLNIFFDQFKSPLIYLLLFAAVIIFFISQDTLDAFIISGVLLFNSILGTIQERRTANIIENLKRMLTTDIVVVRDGKRYIVLDEDLVVGDIIILQEGQKVPADARILESHYLYVDESILTGESQTVLKVSDSIQGIVALSDQKNMVFRGTSIMAGSGIAVVTHIGVHTQVGKIHRAVEGIKTDIPLRHEVERVSYIILIFIIAVCALLFIMGLIGGKSMQELLVMLTALFICVVPEGLPVALTLVLTAGAYRMAQHHVLVKNLQAVEALGRTNILMVDKTGTLTRNEMMVTVVQNSNALWNITGQGYHTQGVITATSDSDAEQAVLEEIAIASSLLNNAEITHDVERDSFIVKGDPTQAALYVFSQKMGIKKIYEEQRYKRLFVLSFDPVKRYEVGFYVTNECPDKVLAYIIGSPEILMAKSSLVPQVMHDVMNDLLDKGLRVVAVAKKIIPLEQITGIKQLQAQEEALHALVNDSLEMLGLCGIEDAVRSDVASIIQGIKKAGLKVIMATGDHQKTAMHVAKKVGIYKEGDEVITGVELDNLSDEILQERIDAISVFARVSPEHKNRIVRLFHAKNYIVAMTGDGINDAPSLVAADLGIAMGRIGSEVAKQSADLILLNDSFASILTAIGQGRHIFYTLKRVILYFFATNLGEILIVLCALLWNMIAVRQIPLVLTAAQILWLNLVTDGFMDVSLSMEAQEEGLLDASWLEQRQQLIDRPLLLKTVFMAIPMAVATLIIFSFQWQDDLRKARTFALILMAMFQWFNAWNCRSNTKSIFQIGLLSNIWFLLAAGFVLSLQLLVVYIPGMQYIFKTVPLSTSDWAMIVVISSSILIIDEIRKAAIRWWNPHTGV